MILSKSQNSKILKHSISKNRKCGLSDGTNHKPKQFFLVPSRLLSSVKRFFKWYLCVSPGLSFYANKNTFTDICTDVYNFFQIIGQIISLILVSIPFMYYENFGEPPKNGFYCNDESIGHPYRPSTVSSKWALALGLSVPLVTIFIVERLVFPLFRKSNYLKG